jgi:hypothetical protein
MASALFYDEGNIMNVQRLVASIIALALAPPDAMAKSYKWNCVYTQRASPQGLVDDRFNLEFAFDDFTRKAAIIGNQGVADVEVHVGQQAVTFMEELNGGVVQTTTVANDGKSVHSRHTIIGREMKPSQYYGECVRR